MKGMANELLLSILIIIGIAVIGSYISLPQMGGYRLNLTYSQDIYTMDNALDAANAYSRTALRYSMYQSCYDALGGGIGILPLEDFNASIAGPAEFIHMKAYTEKRYTFLGSYEVKLPEYELEITSFSPAGINVSAKGGKMSIASILPELVATLRAGSSFTEEVPTDCFGLYLEGNKSSWDTKKAMWGAVKRELDKWPKGKLEAKRVSGTTYQAICDAVFSASNKDRKTMEEAGNIIKEAIKRAPIPGNARMLEPEARINWTFVSKETNDDGTVNAICSFLAEANASARITLNGTIEHPVYNGTDIIISNLTARFLAWINATAVDILFPDVDVTGPRFVEGPAVKNIGYSTAVMHFKADEPVKAILYIWETGIPTLIEKGEFQEKYQEEFEIDLLGMAPGTAYTFNVTIWDQSGNKKESEDISFHTMAYVF